MVDNVALQKARIRALATKLIHQPPLHFNVSACSSCAVHVACTMPEFQALGWRNIRRSFHIYPKLPGIFEGHLSIQEAAEQLGLELWHVGYDTWGRHFIGSPTAFHVGITYLEYIGDCGPLQPEVILQSHKERRAALATTISAAIAACLGV